MIKVIRIAFDWSLLRSAEEFEQREHYNIEAIPTKTPLQHVLATLAISIALTTPSIATPIYPNAENPIAAARVVTDSANCRKAPSLRATVQHEIAQNTPVSLDIRTAVPGVTLGRFGGSRWVFEYSHSCWVHESGIFWMESGDPKLNEVLPIVDR